MIDLVFQIMGLEETIAIDLVVIRLESRMMTKQQVRNLFRANSADQMVRLDQAHSDQGRL